MVLEMMPVLKADAPPGVAGLALALLVSNTPGVVPAVAVPWVSSHARNLSVTVPLKCRFGLKRTL